MALEETHCSVDTEGQPSGEDTFLCKGRGEAITLQAPVLQQQNNNETHHGSGMCTHQKVGSHMYCITPSTCVCAQVHAFGAATDWPSATIKPLPQDTRAVVALTDTCSEAVEGKA